MAGLHSFWAAVDAVWHHLLPRLPARLCRRQPLQRLHGLHHVLCQPLGLVRQLLPLHCGGLVPGRHGHCRHVHVRLQCRILLSPHVYHVRLLQQRHKSMPRGFLLPRPGQRPHSLSCGHLGRCHQAHHGLLFRPVRAGLLLPCRSHHCDAESVSQRHVRQYGWPGHLCLLWPVPGGLLVRSWLHLQHSECLSSGLLWRHSGAHKQRLQRRVRQRLLLPHCIHQLPTIFMPARVLWRSDGPVLALLQWVLQPWPLLPFSQHLPHANPLPCGRVWLLWGPGNQRMHCTLLNWLLLQRRSHNAHPVPVPTRHLWVQRGRGHCAVQWPVPQRALWRHCRADQLWLHWRLRARFLLHGRQHQCNAVHVPSGRVWECGGAVLTHLRGRVPSGKFLPCRLQPAHALPSWALWICHWRHQRCLHWRVCSGLCMRGGLHLAAGSPLPRGQLLSPRVWRSAPAQLSGRSLLRPWKRSAG